MMCKKWEQRHKIMRGFRHIIPIYCRKIMATCRNVTNCSYTNICPVSLWIRGFSYVIPTVPTVGTIVCHPRAPYMYASLPQYSTLNRITSLLQSDLSYYCRNCRKTKLYTSYGKVVVALKIDHHFFARLTGFSVTNWNPVIFFMWLGNLCMTGDFR